MSQPYYRETPEDRSIRKRRNRLRLLTLLTIFPIYKTADYLARNDMTLGILMGLLSIGYLVAMGILLARNR